MIKWGYSIAVEYFKPDGSNIIWHQRSLYQDKCVICRHTVLFTTQQEWAQSRAEFKVRNIQRKSYDVDTRDIAGVRKHPGLTGQHINLATNTACSYLLGTRAPPGTKEALPQTASQVLDIFITLLAASILSNKRSPRLCVTCETKPNQDKWIPRHCDCLKCGGAEGGKKGSILSHIFLTQQHRYNKCALFGRQRHRGETDAELWQFWGWEGGCHQMYQEKLNPHI